MTSRASGELKIDVSPLRNAMVQLGINLGVLAEEMTQTLNTLGTSMRMASTQPYFAPKDLNFSERLLVIEYVLDSVPANDPQYEEALKSAQDFIVYLKGLVEETT